MPHSRRLTPEATDDDRDRDSRERNPSNASHADNDDPSPPVASSRRDENSISFRHFLQPHSDVVPSRHRNSRGPNSGSVDLVDGAAMALPDFVQDHLVLDSVASSSSSASASGINSMGNGDHLLGATSLLHHSTGGSPLDLSASALASNSSHSHNDFSISTSQRTQSYLSKRNRRHHETNSNNSVSHSNGDVVPNLASASHSQQQQQGPVALPDFLSDGPMLCSTNNTNSHGDVGAHLGSSNCSSPRRSSGGSGHSRPSNSSRDSSEPLSQQIERLRRELAEKNRRLSQLESDLTRQRSESSMFETAYLNSEQGLQAATRRALAAEARVAELNNELQFFKHQLSERMTLKRNNGAGSSTGTGSSSTAQPSQPSLPISGSSSSTSCRNGPTNPNLDSNRVMEIAFSAEFLVGELMEQLDALKLLAVTSSAAHQPAPKEKEADSENSRGNSNATNPTANTNFSTSSSTNSKDKDKSKLKDGPKMFK